MLPHHLNYFHDAGNGNTTTYEWVYKEKPLKVEEPSLNIPIEEEGKKNDTVCTLYTVKYFLKASLLLSGKLTYCCF